MGSVKRQIDKQRGPRLIDPDDRFSVLRPENTEFLVLSSIPESLPIDARLCWSEQECLSGNTDALVAVQVVANLDSILRLNFVSLEPGVSSSSASH